MKLGKVCAVSQANKTRRDHFSLRAAKMPMGTPINSAIVTAEITE